ncbi:hypothetical protein NQ314_006120 [Rhamnusium bicolor]|uniref:Uncharacterized protein n=1 Tax=Rhamnusium bicolor TaxID=1586634 RepID=A0AAV8Z803_9CUCU|nr:hypothetical protein NQ314_006120 [Rhamnusium bicolor]
MVINLLEGDREFGNLSVLLKVIQHSILMQRTLSCTFVSMRGIPNPPSQSQIEKKNRSVAQFDRCDYNEFLDDLEEDAALRQNINIFKDKAKQIPIDSNDSYDEMVPHITLEEMLDDLVIDEVEMDEV